MNPMIEIDFITLTYMVIAVFGLVGFLRGWWKEAITTGLLTILLVMLKEPNFAGTIVEFIGRIVGGIWDAVTLLFESSEVISTTVQVQAPPEVDAERYSTYIIILVLLVIASYFFGKMGLATELSAGARILGALMGFYNGFVIVSLVREFMVGRFLPGASDVSATAAPPSSMSLQVTNLPQASIADSPTAFFLISIGFVVFFLALVTGWRVDKMKVGRKEPPLYRKQKKSKRSDDEY